MDKNAGTYSQEIAPRPPEGDGGWERSDQKGRLVSYRLEEGLCSLE
jgi:hypothetical protein